MVYYNGKVALQYYMPVPKYINVGGREYVTDVRHGVSLLFVEPELVPRILDLEGGCCGGKRKIFSLCGQEAFNVWLTGNR
jgi:hypothetical protein